MDHGVSSPSVKTCSVPYTDTVSAYETRPRTPIFSSRASSTAHWVNAPGAGTCEPISRPTATAGASSSTGTVASNSRKP